MGVRGRYLTDSINSVFFKHFVNDHQLCGAVSYNLFENAIAAYEVVFSNVKREEVQAIKPHFDAVIAR